MPDGRRGRLAGLAIAVGSCVVGAVVSLMPALVVGIVELFYNSAGGFLILLGGLVHLAPASVMPGGGGSSLPVFQVLGTDTGIVLAQSIIGAVLCVIAAALLLASRSTRKDPKWLVVGICCILAGIAGGWVVALMLVPALVVCGRCLLFGRVV